MAKNTKRNTAAIAVVGCYSHGGDQFCDVCIDTHVQHSISPGVGGLNYCVMRAVEDGAGIPCSLGAGCRGARPNHQSRISRAGASSARNDHPQPPKRVGARQADENMFLYAKAYLEAENDDDPRIEKLVNDLESEGASIGVWEWNSVLIGLAQRGEMKKAFETMRLMEDAGVDPDVRSFNNLLNACVKANRTDLAFEVMRSMVAAGVQGSEITYNSLVNGCAKDGDLHGVRETLDLMVKDGMKPTAFTFGPIIAMLARKGRMKSIFETLDEMRSVHGITPNLFCLNGALQGAAHAGDRDAAERIVRMMKSADHHTRGHAAKFDPPLDLSSLPTKSPAGKGKGKARA